MRDDNDVVEIKKSSSLGIGIREFSKMDDNGSGGRLKKSGKVKRYLGKRNPELGTREFRRWMINMTIDMEVN